MFYGTIMEEYAKDGTREALESLRDNVYLYYDTIRLPCHVYGNVGIRIEFVELVQPLDINGEEVEVILEGNPEYIAHID